MTEPTATPESSTVTEASTATEAGTPTASTPEAGTPTASTPTASTSEAVDRHFRKTREGLVVSDKMNKTVVVAVEDRVQHPLYKKTLRRTNKLKAHDEQNACGIGDRVLLMETRPLSASKRWRVVEVLEKAK
ncbi:MAG TPA: 30S ribosomal protein S17 [Mycobacteriales bacterium]|jgi:small subunit ribosomal protein S17|nr:30S ribosomal protein S17 [Mycobacteriales bacterium]